MFKDRYEAAFQLAAKLSAYRNKNGIILAVPKGGLPLGYVLSRELGLPLEIILSKKIGHPFDPEYAIGSVSLHGAVLNDNLRNVSMEYIRKETERISGILKEKYKLYMSGRSPAELKDKTVIIVDDGIATGNTLLAAIGAIREKQPKEIIIAAPVGSSSAIEKLSGKVNKLVCLLKPLDFRSVGQYYKNFSDVSEEEAIRLLQEASKKEKAA